MEPEEVTLKSRQEISSISLRPADNGGCVLTYTIYTPSLKETQSEWDEHTEVYGEDEIETKALPKILELYRKDLNLRRKT